MGEEIKIELPDAEPETEETSSVADEVIIDELAALKDLERERITADILAATELAKVAHELAQGAHDRIDEHANNHAIDDVTEVALEAIAESQEPEPVIEEIEPEPEPEKTEDKEPERKHWFYR
jgi:hypothetical protein